MALQDCAYPTPGFQCLGMRTHDSDIHAVAELLLAAKPKVIIEVGVWTGGMTTLFAQRAERVFCVDHWRGSESDHSREMLVRYGGTQVVFDTFCRNLAEHLMQNVFPIRGESREIAAIWPAGVKADLVYIDAGHDYENCAADIAAWLPHVKPGGFIGGHDYDRDTFPGVVRAVDELDRPIHSSARVWWTQIPAAGKPARQARRPRPGGETGRRAFSTQGA